MNEKVFALSHQSDRNRYGDHKFTRSDTSQRRRLPRRWLAFRSGSTETIMREGMIGMRTTNMPFGTKLALLLLLGSMCSNFSTGAQSQTLNEEEVEQQGLAEQPTAGDWNITIGAGAASEPVYPGASAYRARPVPFVAITYRNLIFLSPAGLGMNVIDWNGFRAGPVLGFEGGRYQSDDPHLNGLGDIQPSATAGIFAAYRFGAFEVSGTARQAVTHTTNGFVGLVRLDYRSTIIPEKLAFIVGPEVEFVDSQYDRTWFGVTPGQSMQSGLPVFTPGAGVKDAGLHASLTYRYGEHVFLQMFGDVKELTGDITNSPLVQNKTQALIGTGAAYHF